MRMNVLVFLCFLFSLAYVDCLNGTMPQWVEIECEVKIFY